MLLTFAMAGLSETLLLVSSFTPQLLQNITFSGSGAWHGTQHRSRDGEEASVRICVFSRVASTDAEFFGSLCVSISIVATDAGIFGSCCNFAGLSTAGIAFVADDSVTALCFS